MPSHSKNAPEMKPDKTCIKSKMKINFWEDEHE
jgi:hypothetical protein